jgi:hypothetical protein
LENIKFDFVYLGLRMLQFILKKLKSQKIQKKCP